MKPREWCLPVAVVLTLICVAGCASSYEPPNHTFTGAPEYYGVGVSVWNGMATPVLIGGPWPVAVPESDPDEEYKFDELGLAPFF